MNLNELRDMVYQANMELERRGLVLYTFGNASGIDRARGLVVIKPSGVAYADLRPCDLVVVDLDNQVVEGNLRPSSDTRTHTALYRAFPDIGGVVHTHSTYATAWAQTGMDLPCYGTTHADYCYGPVPCTAVISDADVEADYEGRTGDLIVNTYCERQLTAESHPMVLVAGHAPFTWGTTPEKAAFHSVVLEELARLATLTCHVDAQAKPLKQSILDKHFSRKHGAHAYYGQG